MSLYWLFISDKDKTVHPASCVYPDRTFGELIRAAYLAPACSDYVPPDHLLAIPWNLSISMTVQCRREADMGKKNGWTDERVGTPWWGAAVRVNVVLILQRAFTHIQ